MTRNPVIKEKHIINDGFKDDEIVTLILDAIRIHTKMAKIFYKCCESTTIPRATPIHFS